MNDKQKQADLDQLIQAALTAEKEPVPAYLNRALLARLESRTAYPIIAVLSVISVLLTAFFLVLLLLFSPYVLLSFAIGIPVLLAHICVFVALFFCMKRGERGRNK